MYAPFTAAYDASGSEGDPDGTLVVVGLAATDDKWGKFEASWQKVLDDFDVPYFHMKELNQRHSGTGIYAKWKDDPDTPRLFLKALVKSIKRGMNKAFIYGTILQDYRSVNQIYKLREGVGSPYVLTAGSCYDLVNTWMRKNYPKHRILHAFEKGDCGQKGLERLAKRHKHQVIPIAKTDPVTGDRYVPFQAADLVAGAYRDAAGKRGKVQSMEEYGEVLNDLARMLPQRALVYRLDNLIEMCERYPDKCARR